jgi:hypothetical protein
MITLICLIFYYTIYCYLYYHLNCLDPIFAVIGYTIWSASAYYRAGFILDEFRVSRVFGNFYKEYDKPN